MTMHPKPLLPEITVNGETIPAEAIAAEAQNHHAPKGKPGLAWRAAARALAIRALLLQEARRRGLSAAPRELEPGRVETEDEALIRQVLEAAIEPESADEDDLRAAYDAQPDRFRAPALYEAAHILIAAPDPAARDAARAKAEAILDALRASPAAFDRLAAEESACPSRVNGGRLGQLAAGDTVPEFEAALATLPEGGLTEAPVESRYGFHVIRLDARAAGAVLPFETVRPRLREAHAKAAWTRAARAFAQRLLDEATLTGLDPRSL
jgi:peptidyl-prolyl cis-trans isomerase C